MNVKVKANVTLGYDSVYYSSEEVHICYTYKAEGFKNASGKITHIYKDINDKSYSDYQRRLLKELGELTREEVARIVEDKVTKDLMFRIASNSHEEEKKRLVKELNNIKFNFKFKNRL